MVLIFDYILQGYSGDERAMSSLKSSNHPNWDPGRPLACLTGNLYSPYQWFKRVIELHKNIKSAGSLLRPFSLVLEETGRSYKHPIGWRGTHNPRMVKMSKKNSFLRKISVTSGPALTAHANQSTEGRSCAIESSGAARRARRVKFHPPLRSWGHIFDPNH